MMKSIMSVERMVMGLMHLNSLIVDGTCVDGMLGEINYER